MVINHLVSIKNAASTVAYGLMKYYDGNGTNGLLGLMPKPYHWWEAGGVWGGLIDYWHLTSDTTYNDVVSQALLSQASATRDFMTPAQIKEELCNIAVEDMELTEYFARAMMINVFGHLPQCQQSSANFPMPPNLRHNGLLLPKRFSTIKLCAGIRNLAMVD